MSFSVLPGTGKLHAFNPMHERGVVCWVVMLQPGTDEASTTALPAQANTVSFGRVQLSGLYSVAIPCLVSLGGSRKASVPPIDQNVAKF